MNFSNLMIALGKLHPAFVHFPIALISIAAFLEILSWINFFNPIEGYLKKAAVANLMLGAIFIIPAAISGLIFASHMGFTPEAKKILFLHMWVGVATGLLTWIAATAWFKKSKNSYRITLILASLLVLTTGYLGGVLVWEL